MIGHQSSQIVFFSTNVKSKMEQQNSPSAIVYRFKKMNNQSQKNIHNEKPFNKNEELNYKSKRIIPQNWTLETSKQYFENLMEDPWRAHP